MFSASILQNPGSIRFRCVPPLLQFKGHRLLSISSTIRNGAAGVEHCARCGISQVGQRAARRNRTRDLPVEVRPQVLYNPSMRALNFFVPGVIGTALQIATVFAVAMSSVRERKRGDVGAITGQPGVTMGIDARQAGSVLVHFDDDGGVPVHDFAAGVFCADSWAALWRCSWRRCSTCLRC